jgi:hypothetical protein
MKMRLWIFLKGNDHLGYQEELDDATTPKKEHLD